MAKLKILNTSTNELPNYATQYSAGMDLRANLRLKLGQIPDFKGTGFEATVLVDDFIKMVLHPNGRVLIPTGISCSIPKNHVGSIRPRSGLALKHGITVLNAPGTIDSDYRGDIGIILYNASDRSYVIHDGDRIAQMVILKYEKVELEISDLEETDRGEGGFGSTGKN